MSTAPSPALSSARAPHAPELIITDPPAIPLTDGQILDFVVNGYIELPTDIPAEVHAAVCRELDAQGGRTIVDRQNDPLSLRFLDAVPSLMQVMGHAAVRGAVRALLGDHVLIYERVVHCLRPGRGGRGWHQDDVNVRHLQMRRLMILYYPDSTDADMGPTFVVPGTHLRNCPTDRMATYGNIRGQVPLLGAPGRIYIVHYDLWHSASRNKSQRTRHMVKYYLDRGSEPTGPAWDHHPETAIPLAMQRLHDETTVSGWGGDYYKERHLRWRLWSYLLGQPEGAVWPVWDSLHPGGRRRAPIGGTHDHQGYVGTPLY